MKYTKNILKIGLMMAILAAQIVIPMPGQGSKAIAGQNCPLHSFYGTVTYDGVATDGVTVTLTDLTNAAPALTTTTSMGGFYLIESANVATCAAVGDQIRLTASFAGSSVSSTVTYAAQAMTSVNLALTSVPALVLADVIVTPATAVLTIGATQQLTAAPVDANGLPVTGVAVSWSSDNPAAATVDINGLVTAVAAGTSTISASATQGATTIVGTASLTVTVPSFTVTSSTGANGSVTPLGATSVASGASQTYTITPNNGFQIADVLVDGVSVGAVATYTFSNVSAAHTISASFSQVVPVLTTVTVTPSPASVAARTTQTFTASPLDQLGAVFSGATITWSTDATSAIGTIDTATGIFTAVAPGTATVTATAVNGATSVSGTAAVTVTPAACVTGADTSGNGTISMSELLSYITRWKVGNTSLTLLLRAIGFWKVGTGC